MTHLLSDESFNLYNVLVNKRTDLPAYLEEHGSHDNLVKLLKEIEKNNTDDVINQIMTNFKMLEPYKLDNKGTKGNPFIFELVTKELVSVLTNISQIINTKDKMTIVEFNSKLGLTSEMLRRSFAKEGVNNVTFVTCEKDNKEGRPGNIPMSASIKSFIPTVKSDIYGYVSKFKAAPSMSYVSIINWPCKSQEADIMTLINRKMFDALIILGEPPGRSCVTKEFFQKLSSNKDYKVKILPIKQICHIDYFKNENTEETISRSCATLLLKNENADIIEDLVEICGQENFHKTQAPELTMSETLRDLAIMEMFPAWVAEIKDEEEIKVLYEVINDILNSTTRYKTDFFIPTWMPANVDMLKFWNTKRKQNKFPKRIKTANKMKAFYALMTNLETNDGFTKLKLSCTFPYWVETKAIAEKYIMLKFSVTSKGSIEWDKDYESFNKKYNETIDPIMYSSGPIRMNTGVNYGGAIGGTIVV